VKTAACLLALCTISSTAMADEPVAYIGPPDCRVVNQHPVEHERVTWSGACKDGYAQGQGVLAWHRGDAVTSRYEGTLVRGQREGSGTAVSAAHDIYAGEFRNGLPEGTGEALYALGGRYEGAFKAGRPHGKGVMTFAGSGRRQEGEFREGKLIGTASVSKEEKTYIQRGQEAHVGSRIPWALAYAPVPTNKSWAQLTREQQEVVRDSYTALAPGDEPPYPLNGPGKLFAALSQAVGKLDASGELLLYVLVGADGKARSVSVLGKPEPQMLRFAAAAVVLEPYKPAVCDGKPCEMLYPFSFRFTMEP